MYARQHAIDHPDQAAIIMATSGETVTYGEYEARCNQVAHFLRSAGLQRGDHISVFMENNPRLLEIAGGAERTGLYFTLINKYLAPDEVAYIVTNSHSRLLFSSAAMREVAEAAAAKCPQLERVLISDPGTPAAGRDSYGAAIAGCPTSPVAGESLGTAMLYSSGTTGQPKGILRPLPTTAPDEPLPSIQGVSAMFGFRAGMTYLNPAPLYHSAPSAAVAGSLRLGATTIVMEHFDAEQWLALVRRYRVTHSQMVPIDVQPAPRLPDEVRAALRRLVAREHRPRRGPVPRARQARDHRLAGPDHQGVLRGDRGQRGRRSATPRSGWPIPGRSAGPSPANCSSSTRTAPSARRGGRDHLVPRRQHVRVFRRPGEDGGNPQANGTATTVGDVGYVDADSYLYLTDRKANMIISGGVNIYPQETENLLALTRRWLDVAVFGVPDEEMGEQVKAVVQPVDRSEAGPALEAELITYCRDSLAHFKCPKSVDFVPNCPDLTGKLYKRVLRDSYWAGHQTSIV